MKTNHSQHVRIRKTRSVDSPVYPAADADLYIPGTYNGEVSVPVEYWIEGRLISPVVVGRPVQVHRTVRNGVTCSGLFQTSIVMETRDITEKFSNKTTHEFETMNSVYQIEYLD